MFSTLCWRRTRVLWLLAILLVASGAWLVVPAQHARADAGDNYPTKWRDPVAQDSVVDDWGEYNRECTSWASFALSDRNGYKIPFHDYAKGWGAKATAIGYAPDNNPAKGAIAWWAANAPGASQWGHVAWVSDVDSSGGITIEQYNADFTGHYSTSYFAKGSTKWPTGFIHFPDSNSSPTPTPKPPPPPDTDGDGIIDSQDPCPLVYGKPNGCPVKADYNQDGRADITAFYRYDNNVTNLWRWNGGSGQGVSAPAAPWIASGWDASRTIPVGSGDFNGDHVQDFAAFYRQDSGLDLNIWYGDGNGGFTMYHAWHVATGWEGARIIPAGVGDFNHDGHDDIAAFYRHDNQLVDLRIWYGQSNGYFPEPSGPWSATGWDGARIIPVGVGDFDGNGKPDILTFYRHDNGMMDLNVWYGDNTGNFSLARPWHVDSGWDGSRFIPAGVGDFNGDGKADMAVFYRHDNQLVDLRIWYGTGNGAPVLDPTGPWSATGWDGARIMPAGVGDYNGDGHMDIATFYRHDNGMLDMNVWYGDGQGLTLARPWHVDSQWEGERLYPII